MMMMKMMMIKVVRMRPENWSGCFFNLIIVSKVESSKRGSPIDQVNLLLEISLGGGHEILMGWGMLAICKNN